MKFRMLPLIPGQPPSLPVRECGLKSIICIASISGSCVTPRAGVWIEILMTSRRSLRTMSLPVRECGLKFPHDVKADRMLLSLPVRECGLKFLHLLKELHLCPSLPVRECGLKYLSPCQCHHLLNVTPRAGVWIEIDFAKCHINDLIKSLPVRECGLK